MSMLLVKLRPKVYMIGRDYLQLDVVILHLTALPVVNRVMLYTREIVAPVKYMPFSVCRQTKCTTLEPHWPPWHREAE